MSNMKKIIQAVAKQQFNAANEMITQELSEKISDALITRKETVGREFAASVNEEKRDYKTFFNAAMKKFNIKSPADLKSEQEKKEFFDYIDKNFKGAEEEMPEPGDPGYVPPYVPQLIRDPRRPIAPYEPTNPVSPKPEPIDPDNPDVIPYMPIPGFIEDPFSDPNNPDRDPTRPLSTPYGSEEEEPEPGEPYYTPPYMPQLIRDRRRPIAPYEPTNPVSPKPDPEGVDPDNPYVIPYMPIPGFIEDPFSSPYNPDRDPFSPISTPPTEGEAYGSEEELMGALQKLMGGSKKKEELRKFQTPGQQDIEQGKKSSPFQLKGFKGKGQAMFTDPAGPVAQNPVEQPGDANPYKSGSAEVRDPAPKGNPMTVGDIDVESDRKRGEFGLGTGAIPAQRKIAGSMTTTDLDRSQKDYDLEDEEELSADAIGSSEKRAARPVEDDPVFKVAKTLDADDGLETDDPFRTTMKLKKRRRA